MKIAYKGLISIIIAALILGNLIMVLGFNYTYLSQPSNRLPKDLIEVYIRLYKIENKNPLIKPNTSLPIKLLKEALDYIDSNVTKALNLIKEANDSLNYVIKEYDSTIMLFYIEITVSIIAIAMLLVIYKLILEKKIFRYWLKLRGNHIVVRGDNRPKSVIFSREALAVILAVLTIGAIIVVVESFRPLISEHYIQLGILDEKGILGNHNIVHPVGDNVTFRVFIGNRLGHAALCNIRIFIVINNTSKEQLYSRYIILGDKENTTIPFTVRINYTGLQNIIVELWSYNPDTKNFVYSGHKVNIWVKGVKV